MIKQSGLSTTLKSLATSLPRRWCRRPNSILRRRRFRWRRSPPLRLNERYRDLSPTIRDHGVKFWPSIQESQSIQGKDIAMRALGYTWAGVRTADLKSTARFFADILGFSLIHQGKGL